MLLWLLFFHVFYYFIFIKKLGLFESIISKPFKDHLLPGLNLEEISFLIFFRKIFINLTLSVDRSINWCGFNDLLGLNLIIKFLFALCLLLIYIYLGYFSFWKVILILQQNTLQHLSILQSIILGVIITLLRLRDDIVIGRRIHSLCCLFYIRLLCVPRVLEIGVPHPFSKHVHMRLI